MSDCRRMDPTLNPLIRNAISETSLQLMNDFCRISTRQTIRKLDLSFMDAVQSYAASALLGQDRQAQGYLKDAHRIIERAKQLEEERNGSQTDSSPP